MDTNQRGPVANLLRQPLLHFLLLGSVIAIALELRGDEGVEAPDKTVRVSAGEVDRLTAEWQARWNRPPTPAELDGVLRARIRETILYREAVRMGLDRGNTMIQRILAQRVEELTRGVVELGLAPTDQELVAYLAENVERYRPEPLISFTQVFVDPDRRGDQTLEDAAEMLASLQSLDPSVESVQEIGDPSLLQSHYPEKIEQRIASRFGREFANSIFDLEAGRWHGPVLSGYGAHLVYVHELRESPPPEFLSIRDRVTQDWVDEKREEILEKYFAEMIDGYSVVIEEAPADGASSETP